MINYKQWKLLNETLGSFNLGLSQKQNLGFVSNFHTGEELEEEGMMAPKYMGDEIPFKGKKKFPSKDKGGLEGDEFNPEGEEDLDDIEGDEENIEGDEENIEGDEAGLEGDEEDLAGDEDELGGDEEDLDIDPDAELDDEDEGGLNPMGKKHKKPMGNPHNSGPFMRFSRRMKAEGCGDEDENEEEELMLDKKGKSKDKDKETFSFLQKKGMKKKMSAGNSEAPETKLGKPKCDGKTAPKGNGGVSRGKLDTQKYETGGKTKSASGFKKDTFKKGCSSGMDDMEDKKCNKCKKQKKMKEASYEYYDRPTSFDNSEEAFMRSVASMYGNPNEKFSSGLRDFSEDLLLPTPPPGPGEIGYSPQTRIGSDANALGESIQYLMKKIADLEKQVEK